MGSKAIVATDLLTMDLEEGHPLRANVPFDLVLAQSDDAVSDSVDVRFTSDEGDTWVIPSFQDGKGALRARFAAPGSGRFGFRTVSSNPLLDGIEGELDVEPYAGQNSLFRHGRLRAAGHGRSLEHLDGKPFLWVGDTWWMGLGTRLQWPDDFHELMLDRREKGFSVIQIVAGPLPDFSRQADGIWHPQQRNEGGWPWDKDWYGLNAAYFDAADRRLSALVRNGLVPCIVGMWAFYIESMGESRAIRHWRELIARYSAMPVIFCVAGEINFLGYDLYTGTLEHSERLNRQILAWTSVLQYVRKVDPYRNPVTVHPAHPDSRSILNDPSMLDINMVQTSHWSYFAPSEQERKDLTEDLGLSQPIRLGLKGAVAVTSDAVHASPPMPVINSESAYEGIMGGNWQDVQRFHFWTGMLSGLAGFTYGADGIWQMSSRKEPFSNTVSRWGTGYWQDAMRYPGSHQVGIGGMILERFQWWELRPVVSWPGGSGGHRLSAFAAMSDKVGLYYFPSLLMDEELRGLRDRQIPLPSHRPLEAQYIDPRTGCTFSMGSVDGHDDGWIPPQPPSYEDWLLVVEAGDL